jgi:hypothetical protein
MAAAGGDGGRGRGAAGGLTGQEPDLAAGGSVVHQWA